MEKTESTITGIVKSMGLVFGDIGTSPIYTLTVVFLFLQPTPENVVGVLSLIIWTLVILVTAEYAWLATSLSKKGEGGSIVMREILVPLLRSSRKYIFYTILALLGISLLVGDGVITPAISILSAVEGLAFVPGIGEINTAVIVIIAAVIAIGLFAFQKQGSDRVSKSFGPIMLIWFLVLAVSGALSIANHPEVLNAFNPLNAFLFLFNNGLSGFFILSSVILCATGGEALYADMGHLGRRPILKAWTLVFFALVLNYMGQGAYAMGHPDAENMFFGLLLSQSELLYLPLLVLAITATVIASQAMISGMFSVVYQGINTGLVPKLKVEYTSIKLKSQIYIPLVNWTLMFAVIGIIFIFESSASLSNAYGLAVTGSMTITGIMMLTIFHLKGMRLKMVASAGVLCVDIIYLAATSMKIPMGGYVSLILSAVPFTLITIYLLGQRRLQGLLRAIPLDCFIPRYEEFHKTAVKIPGTALFFVKNSKAMPRYVKRVMFENNIIYKDNVIVSIVQKDEPYGIEYGFKDSLASGLRHFEIEFGYMETLDVNAILKKMDLKEKAIFYGIEEINTKSVFWKVYAIMKRLTPSSVRFYKLPLEQLHGVIVRIDYDRAEKNGNENGAKTCE